MLAMMVFVTSPLNDLGDIKGDKEAGRRTIPIVLGKEHTVLISLLITIGMIFASWVLFVHSYSIDGRNGFDLYKYFSAIRILSPLTISGTCVLIIFHLLNVLKRARRPKLHKRIGKQKIYSITSNITTFSCHRLPITMTIMKV
jgi:geranylgeranylglycerol-phosphate geranylgeranyltransferase